VTSLDIDDLERCAEKAGVWKSAILALVAEVRELRPLTDGDKLREVNIALEQQLARVTLENLQLTRRIDFTERLIIPEYKHEIVELQKRLDAASMT
jgi:hypothetical protein